MKKLVLPMMVGSMLGGAFIYKTLTDKSLNINFSIESKMND